MDYTKEELKLINSRRGLLYLLSGSKPRVNDVLEKLKYDRDLRALQTQLIRVQQWVVDTDQKVLIIFEGAEFAGKGAAITTFAEHLNPRVTRIVALPKPNAVEEGQWYFQRYVMQLPRPGEITLFDRSWYNRALVEPVNDFCTEKEYHQFMNEVNHFERMICNDGILLLKNYLSISKKVQARRIEMIRKNPLRRWELSKVDENAQKLWSKYKEYEERMLSSTDSTIAPWKIIDANDQRAANIAVMQHALDSLPFKT